jgi:RNA-directed DNA polymerase
MKRVGNLKEKWCSYEALFEAFQEVKKNKNYHHNILLFESELVSNLNRILISLEDGTYKIKPARAFYVYDPKERLIEAPHIEDRIVQHAVLNAVRDIIEVRFIDTSYACRREKGTHRASDMLKKYLVNYKGRGYYLKVDISKFFYSINHKAMEQLLRKVIKCEPTLGLLKKFYENETGVGLPLGNVTSQVLANLMLNPVDHLIKRFLKRKHYLRYMDDLVILGETKEELKRVLRYIKILLKGLKLEVNSKTQIAQIKDGVDFVGYRTWYNSRLIRKRSLYKLKRVIKKYPEMSRIASYLSHSKRTNSLLYVVQQILKVATDFEEFVRQWLINNNKSEVYYEVFQS